MFCFYAQVSLISLLPILTTNVSAVRTLRVLRPLRTLSLLPGMRDLINTMLNALPMLGNVILLSMFLFVVFGILGVQLFKGALRNRCHYVDWDAEEGARAPLLLPEFADVTCTNYTSSYHGESRRSRGKGGFELDSGPCLPLWSQAWGVDAFAS